MQLKSGSILHCMRSDSTYTTFTVADIALAVTPEGEDQIVLSNPVEGLYVVYPYEWLISALETTKYITMEVFTGIVYYHVLSVTVDSETHIRFNIH